MGRFTDIQEDVIKRYRIDICDGSRCEDGDWSRTHAHPKKRRVCKWKQANSFESTFTLLHEVGHIVANKSWMRRCEEEWYATQWAIEEALELGLEVPRKTINRYQRYIDMEKRRGTRRGGKDYNIPCDGSLELMKNLYEEMILERG